MNYDNYDCRIRVVAPKATKATRRKTAAKSTRKSRLSRVIGAAAVAICSLATVASGQVVFQPQNETQSKDVKVYNHASFMGFQSDLSVTHPSVEAHFSSLIYFDISSLALSIQASEVTSAYLTLYSTGYKGSAPAAQGGAPGTLTAGGLVSVSPILNSWRENGADTASGPLATYDTVYGIPANGSTPAVDPVFSFGSPVATTAIGAGPGYYTWDVTNLVRSWLSGTPNHGLFLQAASSTTDVQFSDTDTPLPGNAPSLTVVPEPGSALLAFAGAAVLFARRRRRESAH